MAHLPFGPFVDDIDAAERTAQLRALAALTACHCGMLHDVMPLLREAEHDAASRHEALIVFDTIPALTRRKILATFARLHYPLNSGSKVVRSTSDGGVHGTTS